MKLYLKANTKLNDKELKEYAHSSLLTKLNIDNSLIFKNEFGKPYILNSSTYFSLSHSKDSFGFVLSNTEVGFDLEKLRKLNNIDGLKKKILNDNDLLNNEINDETLLRIWTIKESYLKYLGIGLKVYPSKVFIDYNNNTVFLDKYKPIKYINNKYNDIIYTITGECEDLTYEIL